VPYGPPVRARQSRKKIVPNRSVAVWSTVSGLVAEVVRFGTRAEVGAARVRLDRGRCADVVEQARSREQVRESVPVGVGDDDLGVRLGTVVERALDGLAVSELHPWRLFANVRKTAVGCRRRGVTAERGEPPSDTPERLLDGDRPGWLPVATLEADLDWRVFVELDDHRLGRPANLARHLRANVDEHGRAEDHRRLRVDRGGVAVREVPVVRLVDRQIDHRHSDRRCGEPFRLRVSLRAGVVADLSEHVEPRTARLETHLAVGGERQLDGVSGLVDDGQPPGVVLCELHLSLIRRSLF
jgi:hypothetical protein